MATMDEGAVFTDSPSSSLCGTVSGGVAGVGVVQTPLQEENGDIPIQNQPTLGDGMLRNGRAKHEAGEMLRVLASPLKDLSSVPSIPISQLIIE